MLFTEPLFLFGFFPLLYLASLSPGIRSRCGARNVLLLLASVGFYAWGEPQFVFVVLASVLADWLLARSIHRSTIARTRRWLLALGLLLNVGLLAYFKYASFFVENLNVLLSKLSMRPWQFAAVALPLGVSFIVFEKITYLVDVHRGISAPARNFRDYLLYVFFFPKLLAGPIVKYHDIKEQLVERPAPPADIQEGLARFARGLAKKVLVADSLAEVADQVFALRATDLDCRNAWLGAFCFALQIYFDFSGYSDMAIGLGRLFGFRLFENFNAPYIAANFTDFWRRWHISLSTWIRDYLYFSLGGNRGPRWRMYANLALCFLLSGLWHGASWHFVLWGVYNGVFLILDKVWLIRAQERAPRIFNILVNDFFLLIGWVIFRATSLDHAAYYLRTMFGGFGRIGQLVYVQNHVWLAILVGTALCAAPALPSLVVRNESPWRDRLVMWGAFATPLLLIASMGKIASTTLRTFLYFRF